MFLLVLTQLLPDGLGVAFAAAVVAVLGAQAAVLATIGRSGRLARS